MQGIKIDLNLNAEKYYACAQKNDQKSLEIEASDGKITVNTWYSYSEKPLTLTAEFGEKITIILCDFRIELYVNGILADEEWPIGDLLFSLGDEILPSENITCHTYEQPSVKEPSVISTFENAEGWRPDGIFVGDCMPYTRGDEYHVLYLKDRRHHKSKWGMGAHQWAHISTRDFNIWAVHPMAVEITKPWEGSICTGSHIKSGDTEYLYYTVRRANGLPAIISRSVSKDGYHFTKDEGFGFTVSEKYHAPSARDPKVFLGEDGKYHMILTTSLNNEEKNGCLAHYTSSDLEKWDEEPEPIYTVPNTAQPECPDYFKYNGKYYLVFSLWGRARYLVSDRPFDGFYSVDDTLIPCAGVPKCAEWDGKLVFVGFKVIDGYAGTMTFNSATSDESGKLVFETPES